MLIINGTVHTMDGPVIPCGYVRTAGDRIAAAGPMEDCPASGEETIDARGGHILPGLIDAHCHLGMFGDSLRFEGEDGNEMTDPCTPQLRAVDSINVRDRCFEEARAAGVTTVLTGPGSANPIGGQFAAIRTAGRWVDEMVLQAPCSMKMALGENPKMIYHGRHETPTTRMASAAVIRENLRKALDYGEKLDKGEKTDRDFKLDALLPVVRRELPVHIHCHRADDIATALRIAREFNLRCVIVHGTEGHLIPELIAREKVPVITGPSLTDRSKPELSGKSLETPAVLARAGVKVAICTDHPVIPVQYLPLCAALAVKGGMDPEEALASVTIRPAEIAGLDGELGSLTPGKQADVLVTGGSPLDVLSPVIAVLSRGERIA